PPPRPPQSTIPQLTSLLINNAGALALTHNLRSTSAARGIGWCGLSPARASSVNKWVSPAGSL
ncbi:ISAs1 family transposase, partial [Mycobacterium ulcerans]|nr:ISAs1 family transposase [Mycobacterium ulcerans]MEB3911378.1 ISAs1 family transposase [Mycobacterium ulcerans]MEB3921616.1 ISAs1 family transposase [Mycobacterium ulcerans]MEB3925749.1 ISAs1 family transposase [Mycobacterium ulcerans]MEB3929877.1 ISAs1 family transposase [Mycobacterium ulcerans]